MIVKMVLKIFWVAIIITTFACNGASKASLLTDCPIYWTAFGDNCYRFFGQRVTLKEARYNCRNHGSADKFANLASIHSQDENDYLATLLKSYTDDSEEHHSHIWIGLNDEKREGIFVWSDGTDVNFTNWGSEQPQGAGSEQGVVMIHANNSQDSLWHDRHVNLGYRYICKLPRYHK